MPHWLDFAALAVGALWLFTSLGGERGLPRHLAAAGRETRGAGAAVWVQRALGAALILGGALGLLRR